ncbi:MAG: Cthe_2314 family HEPN domain-containing protein [Chitinophagaceae bacterium]|nr:Cthe_2314 family HEPN domain-containing protein [Chitinophagaceae bacterium]
MTKNVRDELIASFQSCSEFYFKSRFDEHKFLFFNKLQIDKLGSRYKVELVDVQFSWRDIPIITSDIHRGVDQNEGKDKLMFHQKCIVNYTFKINSVIYPPVKSKNITFVASTFKPFGLTFFPSFHETQNEILNFLTENKIEIKKQLNLLHIDEQEYDNSTIGIAFYSGVIRKERITNPKNQGINHLNYYYEIANCHWQIEDCLLKALYYFKYTTDFLSKRVDAAGTTFFMPTMNNYDNQYLIYIGFGLERVYSFWDRMTILLHSFDDLNLNEKNVSFYKYMDSLKKAKNCTFNKNSSYFLWLSNFYDKAFMEMVEYRHRIVHFQFTDDWAGVLTAKFSSISQQNIVNEDRLQELKIEFEGLLKLLHDNYLNCISGFVNVLKLIDQIK